MSYTGLSAEQEAAIQEWASVPGLGMPAALRNCYAAYCEARDRLVAINAERERLASRSEALASVFPNATALARVVDRVRHA